MKISAIPSAALAAGIAFAAIAFPAYSTGVSRKESSAKDLIQAKKNKHLVLEAYQGLFGDHDLTVIDRYWAKDYIQHNPYMSDGRDSVKEFVQKMGMQNWPKFRVNFLRVAADGDLVFLQTVQPKTDKYP